MASIILQIRVARSQEETATYILLKVDLELEVGVEVAWGEEMAGRKGLRLTMVSRIRGQRLGDSRYRCTRALMKLYSFQGLGDIQAIRRRQSEKSAHFMYSSFYRVDNRGSVSS